MRERARKLDVALEQLRAAIEAVGDRTDDVEMHLEGSAATTQAERRRTRRADQAAGACTAPHRQAQARSDPPPAPRLPRV